MPYPVPMGMPPGFGSPMQGNKAQGLGMSMPGVFPDQPFAESPDIMAFFRKQAIEGQNGNPLLDALRNGNPRGLPAELVSLLRNPFNR
jgi:hypothetical protein